MTSYKSKKVDQMQPKLEEKKQKNSENTNEKKHKTFGAAVAPKVSPNKNSVSFAPIIPYYPHLKMQSIRISLFSDAFDPWANFIGMIVYGYNGQSDFTLNGKHCKAGYILIKRADAINHIQGDTMHKKLFKWFFGRDLDVEFSGGGFAYQNGKWKHNSFSFNTNQDFYHDNQKGMHHIEQEVLGRALTLLYINHQWTVNPNLSVKTILSSDNNGSSLFKELPVFISIPYYYF
ncbi:unnamed protein product [Rotaria sordida]|uniref:Uncharacterized protein n=2 Tax=Rotaria sordida TaxID=392033 RepID=A0A815NKX6_9BILA|nr:unnamed protein product [Rotaria sordida]